MKEKLIDEAKLKLAKMYCECSEGDDSNHSIHTVTCPVIQGQFTDFETLQVFLEQQLTKAYQQGQKDMVEKVLEIVEKRILTEDSVYNYYDVEKDEEVAKKMTGAYNAGLVELKLKLKEME